MTRREFFALAASVLGVSAFKLKAQGTRGSMIFTSANPAEALKRLIRQLGSIKLVPADKETRRLLSISGNQGFGKRAIVFARELKAPVETDFTVVEAGKIRDPRKKYSKFYSYLRKERKGKYLVSLVFENIRFGSSKAVVELGGRRIAEFSLKKDGEYRIRGYQGDMLINVKGGRVAVAESSCQKKICVKTGYISSPHEKIVCVPNRVVVSIEGKGLDGVSF